MNHHGQPFTVTGNGYDRVGHVAISSRQAGRGRGPDMDDNMAAVSSISRCGGGRDERACLVMRLLGRFEPRWRWNSTARHIPGMLNALADGISRWLRLEVAHKVTELTNSTAWSEQDIGSRGWGVFNIILQATNIVSKHDDIVLNLMSNE